MDINKERLNNNYDFLRLFAALCIAFTHSFNLLKLNNTEPLMAFTTQRYDFSFAGLCIFFSISGYLITKSATTSTSILNYLWKRFLRIQPLLIIVCLLSVFVLGPIFTNLSVADYFKSPSTWTYFKNIFPATGVQFPLPGVFVNNVAEPGVNGSLWTLVVEERLYFFLGLLFFLKANKRWLFISFILFLNVLFVVNELVYTLPLPYFLSGSSLFYSLIFLNAGLLYLFNVDFNRLTGRSTKAETSYACFYILSLLILLLAVTLLFSSLQILQVALIPFFVIMLAHIKGATNKTGKRGDFTYGMYIFAFPVQQILIAVNAASNNPYILFAETFLIVLPLAILSWHFIEKKFLALKTLVK